jgi:hypothetical protein
MTSRARPSLLPFTLRHAAAGVEEDADAHGNRLAGEIRDVSPLAVLEDREVVFAEPGGEPTVSTGDGRRHRHDIHAASEAGRLLRLQIQRREQRGCGDGPSHKRHGIEENTPAVNRSARLRLSGKLSLAIGVAVAAVVYWLQTRTPVVDIDEGAAGFTRAQEHQIKMMMGPLAVTMSQWADALTRPATQALLIVAFAAFVAYMCFRHARMEEGVE